jgi:hypothetical protein
MSHFDELDRFQPGAPHDPFGDKVVLRQLEAHGADLSKPTRFIHYLLFPDRERAIGAGKLIADHLGYDVRGSAPQQPEGAWIVMAEREEIPTLGNIDRMRQALTLAADQHGGEYDEWEAAIRR